MSRGREHGFGLLEVLIALLIAGLAMATALRAGTEGLRASATAERYQEAISRARSRLDALATRLIPGEEEGEDGGGFRWRSSVRALGSTGRRDAAGRPMPNTDTLVVTLFATSVWVSWKDGGQVRSLRLDSARLQTTAPG